MSDVHPDQCPICAARRSPLYAWGDFAILGCEACGTHSVEPLPTEAELSAFYQQISAKKMVRWEIRQQLVERAVTGHLETWQRVTERRLPDAFVDIGGGVGHYVKALERRGVRSCLLEWADDALDFARNTLGVGWAVQGDVQDCAKLLEPESFDYAQARHVIEHVREPQVLLAGIARILRADGLLQIETPNVRSWEQLAHPGIMRKNLEILRDSNPAMSASSASLHALRKSMSGANPPKHLWGFSAQGLRLLLERSGFEVLEVRSPPAGHPIHDPLYYDLHRLADRRGLGVPYYFWERSVSLLLQRRGAHLAILARRRSIP